LSYLLIFYLKNRKKQKNNNILSSLISLIIDKKIRMDYSFDFLFNQITKRLSFVFFVICYK
jgi:hypothetical protein